MPNLLNLVIQIAVILAAARLVGILFAKMGQPQVVGEMAAGIMLGPSLMGWLLPNVSAQLFPASSLGFLSSLSQVGLVLFMFLVGLGINTQELHKQGHAAVLTSHVSIVAPLVLASVLSLFLYPRLSDDSMGFMGFALFMGAAMSITAFPVLARILTERNMLQSRLGTLAIACAAVDDVSGWCILAVIVALIRSPHGSLPIWATLGGTLLYVLVMVQGVRFLLTRFETIFLKQGKLCDNSIALILLFMLVSAVTTEALGLHLLFGAFLAGAVMPKNKKMVDYLTAKFEATTVLLLLPLFFAFSGLRTRIGLVRGWEMWGYCAVIIAVAVVGKLGGCMVAARTAGMGWRDASALGVLMNTRGLMELVILNIGLDLKVISPALFSMMVLMALVTTYMTSPLLLWIYPARLLREELRAAEVPDAVGQWEEVRESV